MDFHKSGCFLCKKWTLFSITLIAIIAGIVLASMASTLVNNYANKYPNDYTEDDMVFVEFFLFYLNSIYGCQVGSTQTWEKIREV